KKALPSCLIGLLSTPEIVKSNSNAIVLYALVLALTLSNISFALSSCAKLVPTSNKLNIIPKTFFIIFILNTNIQNYAKLILYRLKIILNFLSHLSALHALYFL